MFQIKIGDTSIGATQFPDRETPSLVVMKGARCIVYGYFKDTGSAEEFMDELAKFFPNLREENDI